jgi:hypothetical protein
MIPFSSSLICIDELITRVALGERLKEIVETRIWFNEDMAAWLKMNPYMGNLIGLTSSQLIFQNKAVGTERTQLLYQS